MIAEKRWLEPVDSDIRPQAESAEPAVRGVVEALLRHRLLLLSIIVLTMALGVVYTMYSTPIYEATTLVRFEAQQVDLPELVQLPYTDNLINTEMEVLRGRNAALAVVDSLGLRANVVCAASRAKPSELFSVLAVAPSADSQTIVLRSQGNGEFVVSRPNAKTSLGVARVGDTTRLAGVTFVPTPAAKMIPEMKIYVASRDGAVGSFASSLELARPARDADLIAIHVRNSDPVRAAAAANFMAKNLIADRTNARKGRTGAAVTFLEQQDDSLGKQLRAAEESLRSYQQREHVIDVPQQASAEVITTREAAGGSRGRARRARCVPGACHAVPPGHRGRHARRTGGVAPPDGLPDAAREPVRIDAARRTRAGRGRAVAASDPSHAGRFRCARADEPHSRDGGTAPGDRGVVSPELDQSGEFALGRGGKVQLAARRAAGEGAADRAAPA